MARLHSHHKGRSGSTMPARDEPPKWSPLAGTKVEEQVVTLAREGKSSAQIGLYMRDQFGVPDVHIATGKHVLAILRENDLAPKLPEDLANLLARVVNMQEHFPRHPKDLHNRRSMHLLESKIRRMARYYKRTGRLAADWAYSASTARLLLE